MMAARAHNDEQAWRWVIHIDAGDWSDEDEAALQAWLDSDPKHPGALLEAEAMWRALGTVAERVPQDWGDEPVASPSGFSRRAWLAGSGAALAASIVGGVFLLDRGTRYSTTLGEVRRVPLPDGSIAAINTASRIEISLKEQRREVRIEQGEAWFQVVKDKKRPFIVEAGRIRVQAVGTAFSVRRRGTGADILVTEGVVEAWADGAVGSKIRLAAGERAFVADNAAVTRTTAAIASVDRALAWRNGQVDFVDDPISDAVAEFNRYNHRQLVILDPAIGRERFDGVFRTDDPEGFARAVHDSLGVHIDLSNDRVIRIGAAAEHE